MTISLSDLIQTLTDASETPLGSKAIRGHNEDYQLEINGHTPISIEIDSGHLSISDGPSPRQLPLRFTRIQLSEETLLSILRGDESPIEAMERGALFIRTRLYGGAQFTMLLRAAYDLARAQRIEKGRVA